MSKPSALISLKWMFFRANTLRAWGSRTSSGASVKRGTGRREGIRLFTGMRISAFWDDGLIIKDTPARPSFPRLVADAVGDALMPEDLPGDLAEALRVAEVPLPVLPELVVDQLVLQD